VSLNHQGKDFYAFYFPDEAGGSYYDEKGRSLETAFLPSPVSTGRITSGFSKERLHPVSGKYTPHYGIDFAAPMGTPIVSIADGVVQEAGDHRTKGKFVRIKHPDGYETEYLHMSWFEKGIGRGASVPRGQIIGYVGTTGIATGPHVELRLKKNGRYVDLSKEKFHYASLLSAPVLDCFQQRVEVFKEYLANGRYQNTLDFVFNCALEKEPGSI
jgi:murein DD-endopeptidase MepM/ murein hydrolase activator NlpD